MVGGRSLFYSTFLAYFITFKYLELGRVGFYVRKERNRYICRRGGNGGSGQARGAGNI